MGDFQYFDIILFAMIAAFLVLRLRSVLGRRTGNERRRELFTRRPAPVADKPAPDKVARPADGNKVTPIAVPTAKPADPVSEGVNRVRRADPSFEPSQFIDGARVAFEMIVTAFAKGDKAALRPLLGPAKASRGRMATYPFRSAAPFRLRAPVSSPARQISRRP